MVKEYEKTIPKLVQPDGWEITSPWSDSTAELQTAAGARVWINGEEIEPNERFAYLHQTYE